MTTATSTHSAATTLVREPFRRDIQGLRAIAVGLVLLFHLWPQYIPGGYVGVDVFFVISGYLITGHLLLAPPRAPRDFVAFWGRRIRRLLPASLLVIATTAIVGSLLLPVTMLGPLSFHTLASSLYFENWVLAADSVNYLSAQAPPSALQHFWSLSVEEQFYVIWPFIVAFAALLARRLGPRRGFLLVLGALVIASFAISLFWTAREPASAYFATPTRLWELGAGGLAAVALAHLPTLPPRWNAAVAWLGLALIAVSAFVLTGTTPFPGFAALLPVAGALLVILARAAPGRASSTSLLSWRPVQFLGDNSYSIYLWHWPMIVILTAVVGTLGLMLKVVIILGACLLAALTKRLIEDPVRDSQWLRSRLTRTFGLAAIATLLVVGISAVPASTSAAAVARDTAQQQEIIVENGSCLGAGALAEIDCGDPHGTGIIPSPADAVNDRADAYDDGCFAEKPFPNVATCTYGVTDKPAVRIALVGNSHAAQWLPALQELAGDRGAEITTFISSGCMPTGARVLFDTQLSSDGCHDWGQRVVDATSSGDFNLIVMSAATNSDLIGIAPGEKFAPQTDGLAEIFEQWNSAGIPVLIIRDTPLPLVDIPQCVASNTGNLKACDGPRSEWEKPDPLVAAAERVGGTIAVVDLNDHLCNDSTCYAVLGGVLVYFDYMHVDATFIRTMAPYLAPALDEALAR